MEGEEEYGIGNLGRYVKRSLGRYVFDGGKVTHDGEPILSFRVRGDGSESTDGHGASLH